MNRLISDVSNVEMPPLKRPRLEEKEGLVRELPSELIINLLQDLKPREGASLALTCQTFNQLNTSAVVKEKQAAVLLTELCQKAGVSPEKGQQGLLEALNNKHPLAVKVLAESVLNKEGLKIADLNEKIKTSFPTAIRKSKGQEKAELVKLHGQFISLISVNRNTLRKTIQ